MNKEQARVQAGQVWRTASGNLFEVLHVADAITYGSHDKKPPKVVVYRGRFGRVLTRPMQLWLDKFTYVQDVAPAPPLSMLTADEVRHAIGIEGGPTEGLAQAIARDIQRAFCNKHNIPLERVRDNAIKPASLQEVMYAPGAKAQFVNPHCETFEVHMPYTEERLEPYVGPLLKEAHRSYRESEKQFDQNATSQYKTARESLKRYLMKTVPNPDPDGQGRIVRFFRRLFGK